MTSTTYAYLEFTKPSNQPKYLNYRHTKWLNLLNNAGCRPEQNHHHLPTHTQPHETTYHHCWRRIRRTHTCPKPGQTRVQNYPHPRPICMYACCQIARSSGRYKTNRTCCTYFALRRNARTAYRETSAASTIG
jgi:hypothetical protein